MKILALCIILAAAEQCFGQDISFNDLNSKDLLQEILTGHFEKEKVTCSCAKLTCSCCQHLSIKKIGLDANVCFSGSYLPKEYGISWELTVNGKAYIHGKATAKNPPTMCGGIPMLTHLAKLCVGFSDFKIHNHTFSGCVELTAKLGSVVVERIKLGCFKLPPHMSGQMPTIRPFSDSEQWKEQPLEPGVTLDQEKTMSTEEETIIFKRMRIMGKKFIN